MILEWIKHKRRAKIILLMDMPPPIHGMSNVNKAVLRAAIDNACEVSVINTVPSYASALFGTKLWFLVKVIHTFVCWIRLLFKLSISSSQVVYRSINGGKGQIYDLVYIGLCRIFGKHIYIHHHSFNYLNTKSPLFQILNVIAGHEAKHVVLGAKMGDLLDSLYGVSPDRIIIVSNVAFFENNNACVTAGTNDHVECGIVIGHLANLCIEKGIGEFIDICRELTIKDIKFTARIAGPFVDVESEKLVLEVCQELSSVTYLGALYGTSKDLFFESLDAFIFISKYKNEAEPLVLYEAAQYGALLIGSEQGCMKEVISSLSGCSVPHSPSLSLLLATTLENSLELGHFNVVQRQNRLDEFSSIHEKAKMSLDGLIHEIRQIDSGSMV